MSSAHKCCQNVALDATFSIQALHFCAYIVTTSKCSSVCLALVTYTHICDKKIKFCKICSVNELTVKWMEILFHSIFWLHSVDKNGKWTSGMHVIFKMKTEIVYLQFSVDYLIIHRMTERNIRSVFSYEHLCQPAGWTKTSFIIFTKCFAMQNIAPYRMPREIQAKIHRFVFVDGMNGWETEKKQVIRESYAVIIRAKKLSTRHHHQQQHRDETQFCRNMHKYWFNLNQTVKEHGT